ncbi:hypothetical protein [Mesorhizobium sp.]|uniref:hypothetical protein n=1 Tax=Mesorhizobium sp. TaxID=1871066 RepID=UPI000FE905DE|nr:hypothetical protein [Mesorhizobium sp.]RWP02724.1 MAG: hypothetical protein EOQ99_22810 [Mesorhizobium sp.]
MTHVDRRQQLSVSIEEQRAELAEAERHASAITAAVAAIASHIHDDDETCPVCQANYPAGELKLLASEAARSGNARVAEITGRVEDLAVQIAVITQRINEISPTLARPTSLEPDASRARQAASDLATALRQSLKSDDRDDLASLAVSRDAAAQSQLADARGRVVAQLPTALAAEQRRATATTEIVQLTNRATAATIRLNGLVAEGRDGRERIAARGIPTPTVDEMGKLLATRRGELEAARKRLGELEGDAAAALAALKPLELQLVARETELANAESAQNNDVQATQELTRQWITLGLTGTPNRATLEAAQSAAEKAATDLALLGNALKGLSSVTQDLLLEEEMATVLAQMLAAGGDDGVNDPDAYLKTLQSRLQPARVALKLSQDAQERWVSGRRNTIARCFNL